MLQTIKNFLKKILPPPVQVFHREIARILDAVSNLRSAVSSLHKEQKKILDEITSMREEQVQLLALNRELRQDFSLKMQEYADMISRLSEDNAALNHEVQRQGHHVLQTLDRKDRRAANVPILSVLIPVYNVETYLRECLDSVVNQSMAEIEIICVDDGSTDASGDILDEYAEKGPRIKVIHKEKNEGLLLARKTAVEAATGAYILFLDSDDAIAPGLCAFAEEVTQNEYADIIQFGADVLDFSQDTKKTAWLHRVLTPPASEYTGEDILEEAYVNRSYVTSLWGKLYKSSLCKKAYSVMPDMYCYVGEDIFTYFYLAYYAQSYKGIPTRAYYTYRHGLGVTNTDVMPLKKFELYCSMATFVKAIYDQLVRESTDPSLLDSYNAMVRRVSEDCCRIYASRIREEDKAGAWKMLTSYWGDNPIAEGSAKKILGVSLAQS